MKRELNYRMLKASIISLIVLVVIYSCDTGASEVREKPDSLQEELVEKKSPEEELTDKSSLFSVSYGLDSLSSKTAVDSFHTRFSDQDKEVIFALNRMDAWRLNEGDKIIIPDTLSGDLKLYSPFPETFDILDTIPKTVLINQRIQAFALYEGDKLVLWGPVSSGKQSTPTPNGLFYGNFKARKKISTVNSDWLMPYYFNFENFEGVGVHQYSMPGYPASHACVRLREQDAAYIYDWAEQWKLSPDQQVVERNGTPFMVFGTYEFGTTEPWLRLADDPNANTLNLAEKDTLKSYIKQYRNDKRNFQQRDPSNELLDLPISRKLETIE